MGADAVHNEKGNMKEEEVGQEEDKKESEVQTKAEAVKIETKKEVAKKKENEISEKSEETHIQEKANSVEKEPDADAVHNEKGNMNEEEVGQEEDKKESEVQTKAE